MSFKRFLAAAGLAGLLALPAGAQTIESEGLGAIDPWASGYISKGDGAFPSDLWTGSSGEVLVGLMQRTATAESGGLTPVENSLLRRILLSPGALPQGGNDGLMDERIRLMLAVGEIDAAIDLMRRVGAPDYVEEADRLTVDMALARGDATTACSGAEKAAASDMYALKLRAVCFAMAGDAPGAELAVELAANAGMDDVWFMTTVLAAVADTTSKPNAQFTDGLSIAASLAARLPVADNTFDDVAPHYALALSARPELDAEWRVLAAGMSAEVGLARAADVRAAFKVLTDDPDFIATSPLMLAMRALEDDSQSADERAQAFEAALISGAGRPERFATLADVLSPGIEALPKSDETRGQALIFARAGLARGDAAAARAWVAYAEETEAGNGYDRAMLANLLVLLQSDASRADAAAAGVALMEVAEGQDEARAAARVFALQAALGVTLSPATRDFLAGNAGRAGVSIDVGDILRLPTLTASDTGAELVLRTLAATRGEPQELSTRDLAVIVRTLREARLTDDARQLALEGMEYWLP